MSIPIYEPQPKTEEYALRLISEGGRPTLCIVDKTTGKMADRGRLCYIGDDGRLHYTGSVNAEAAKALGITLDGGYIARA